MFTLEQIKNMDTIVLTEGIRIKIQEEMDTVTREKGKEWLLPFEVIFNTAVIKYIVEDKIMYIVFNIDSNLNVETHVYYHYRHNGSFYYVLSCVYNVETLDIVSKITYAHEKYTGIKEFAEWVQGGIVFVLSYLTYKSAYVEKNVSGRISTNKMNSSRQNKNQVQKEKRDLYIGKVKVTLVNKNKILDGESKLKRKYTTSWTVRGHYRTLKDGRQIFVRSYKKGKDKEFKSSAYLPYLKKGNS